MVCEEISKLSYNKVITYEEPNADISYSLHLSYITDTSACDMYYL